MTNPSSPRPLKERVKRQLSTPHALSHWAAENFSQRSKVILYLPSPYHTLWRTSATIIPHFSCLSSFQFFACLCRTYQERSLQSHSSFFFSPIYTPKKLWSPKQLPDFYQQPPTMDWLNSLAFLLPLRLLSCAYNRGTMSLSPSVSFDSFLGSPTTCQRFIRLFLLSPFTSQPLQMLATLTGLFPAQDPFRSNLTSCW